jgi:ATP adenylyltransferase
MPRGARRRCVGPVDWGMIKRGVRVLTANGDDAYPVTPLHTLVVPRRHAATYFDLHEPERRAINLLLDQVRLRVLADDKAVQGFNVGMNCGETAGQTIMHCHVHLIPRRPGDVDRPCGGIRAVIPGKAVY